MARIAEAELERLKREVDLVELVEASGVKLRRHGADLVGLCPFHEDRSPSLVVSPGKNLWHCLGACRAGGTVIDWVMRKERVSFRHAVEILLRGEPAGARGSAAALAPLPPLFAPDAADAELLGQVIDYYHETLLVSPEAVAYLDKRGLNRVEAVDRFRLGYANRTLGYRLPKKALKAGAEIRGRLERLGILRASGHEHFTGSLVVPVFGERGEVVEVYGRKIRDDLREGTPYHLYLPGPHRGVWNREALARSKEIILCESLVDALTFWCAGLAHVTAAYGVNGFTEEHLAAFRQHGTERVLIAYDRDEAGEKAAAALAERLLAEGIECYRVVFPRGMDANAYALKVRPAERSLAVLVQNAVWLGRAAAPAAGTSAAEPGPATARSGESVAGGGEMPADASPSAASSAAAPALSAPASPSPVPPPPAPALPVEVRERELVIAAGERSYRVRGLEKNLAPEVLRVNLLVRQGGAVHVDTLDLYVAKQRAVYVKQAAAELGASEEQLKKEVGQVLLRLEMLQDERIREALLPRAEPVRMSEEEKAEALALLGAPDLLERVLGDFERAGVVGEETNKLAGYLAAVSRKLERPLAVILQSSSAAGKTSLMDAVLSFVPEEERIEYSAMTGQALFYMGEKDLRHKVLAVVEEEGAERASYALKLLQSEGCLTIASTGKDPHTGKLVTEEYRVEGPVAIMLTTTAVEIDEELLNRALVLAVSEDREQTRAIHRRQRERRTLAGLMAKEDRARVLRLHQNAQRLLRPLAVVNPYALRLTFLDTRTRTRRDHEKYLTLIDCIALLHQHQREVRMLERHGRTLEYVEVTPDDIRVANRLAGAVLGRSLDELPPQTRRFLEQLQVWASAECAREGVEPARFRFTARQVREALGSGATQTKIHLRRLVDLEYVLVHRTGAGYGYELLYQGEGASGESFLVGLLDVDQLEPVYDTERAVREAERPGSGRAAAGAGAAGSRGARTAARAPSPNRIPPLAAGPLRKRVDESEHAPSPYVVAASRNGHDPAEPLP